MSAGVYGPTDHAKESIMPRYLQLKPEGVIPATL